MFPESIADRAALAMNEALRAGLAPALNALGHGFRARMAARIAAFAADQARLRAAYRIDGATPIHAWGPEVEAGIAAFAARHPGARFAATSGSTARPKRVAFTAERLRTIKLGSLSVAARLLVAHGVRRPSLFIFSSLKDVDDDDSLTALLLSDRGRAPSRPLSLLMPGKWVAARAFAPLVAEHGANAVRLMLLVLSDPGLLYGTNPSTLAVFLDEVARRWDDTTALVRVFARSPDAFGREVRAAARAVLAPGFERRIAAIESARGGRAAPIASWLPSLEGFGCWDGGYVRPFLERIRAHLPAPRYRHVPMYSMATETVQTLNWFGSDGVARFLAIAPRVLYEFVPAGAPDRPDALVAAADLQPGRDYAMVVSDPWGLRRYQTDDLFHCRAKVGAVPDLVFLRRRSLSYSFTGEKLTGAQAELAFARLREALPALAGRGVQMVLIPSRPSDAALPHYRLVLADPDVELAETEAAAPAAAERVDRALGEINAELAAKRASGRLGPVRGVAMRYDALAAVLDPKTRGRGDVTARAWESQFKLLPLLRRVWEELPWGADAP